MSEELIVVRQLPIIEEQLKSISEEIKVRVSAALSMEVSESNYKEIKQVRSDLNKSFEELETKRKDVKGIVLAPYNAFEAIYKVCVTDIFKPADAELKRKIESVEFTLKAQKQKDISDYFEAYAKENGIDFITFEQTGVQVTMAASVKSLKTAIKAFVDKITDELALIETQENKAEILVEYKATLNVARAVTTVTSRHAAIEAENKRREAMQAVPPPAAEPEPAPAPAQAPAPAPISPPPAPSAVSGIPAAAQDAAPEATPGKTFTAQFSVRCSLDQLRALKQFLDDGQYSYTEYR